MLLGPGFPQPRASLPAPLQPDRHRLPLRTGGRSVALSQITENRKVWTRTLLIFQYTIFGFCLEKAILRQSPLRSIDGARRVKALHRLTEVIPHPLYKRSIPRPGLSQLRA